MEVSPIVTADEAGHRKIVVALDTDIESLRALDWVQEEFYKPGDIVHMVHVCKCMSAPLEVFHGTPLLSQFKAGSIKRPRPLHVAKTC